MSVPVSVCMRARTRGCPDHLGYGPAAPLLAVGTGVVASGGSREHLPAQGVGVFALAAGDGAGLP